MSDRTQRLVAVMIILASIALATAVVKTAVVSNSADKAQSTANSAKSQSQQTVNFLCGVKHVKCQRGPHGAVGPIGPQGRIGPQGTQGLQGPSLTPTMFKPVILDDLRILCGSNDCHGPQGERGPQGEIGPEGTQGPQGAAGPQGAQGPAAPPPAPGTVVCVVQPPDPTTGQQVCTAP